MGGNERSGPADSQLEAVDEPRDTVEVVPLDAAVVSGEIDNTERYTMDPAVRAVPDETDAKTDARTDGAPRVDVVATRRGVAPLRIPAKPKP